MASLRTIDASKLGNIDPTTVFEPQLRWTHFLYQVSHVGQEIRPDPTANAFITPAVRVLGFCNSLKEAEARSRFLGKHVPGPILIGERAQPAVVIARTSDRMRQRAYQQKRRTQITQAYVNHAILLEEMFAADQMDKLHDLKTPGSTEGQQRKFDRETRYINWFNTLPWVQLYRRRFHIDPEILVKRGSAMVAVSDTMAKHRMYAETELKLVDEAVEQYVNAQMSDTPEQKEAARAEREALVRGLGVSPEEVEEHTFEGNADIPSLCRTSGQDHLIFSYVLDDSQAMEPMIIVYGFCSEPGFQQAKEVVTRTVTPLIMPLNCGIFPMYQWMCPYDFGWAENDVSQMTNLETAASHEKVNELRRGRQKAQQITQNKVKELLEYDKKSKSTLNIMLTVLGITEVQYEDAVRRMGKDAVTDALLSLPSVKPDVDRIRQTPEAVVLMSDIFVPTRTLTPDDKAALDSFFVSAKALAAASGHGTAAANAEAVSKAEALLQSFL